MKLNQIIVEVEDLERALIKIRVQSGKPDDVNKAQNEAEVSLSSSSYFIFALRHVTFLFIFAAQSLSFPREEILGGQMQPNCRR